MGSNFMDLDLNVALGLDETDESASDSIDCNSTDFECEARDTLKKTDIKLENVHTDDYRDDVVSAAPEEKVPQVDIISELIGQIEDKLESGCALPGLEQVYLFYCEYARLKGLCVQRGDQRFVGNTKDMRWKEFVCSSSGQPFTSSSKVVKYQKQVTRTECNAKIRVHPVGCEWKITRFSKDHNHTLVPTDQTFLLRSSRHLTESWHSVIQSMRSVGIPVNLAMNFVEQECGGSQNVGYLRKDVYDHMRRMRMKGNTHENGDAVALLEYLNRKSNEESSFFWKVKYGEDNRLLHFFMRDTHSLNDYIAFGDIVSIDTTHKTNKYNLSCAPFVGLNHHSTNVMFGIAFLSDETTETFEWLLETFLEVMAWKQPGVVFSDQCRALMNAIDSKFPDATHRLCQWHINNNATKHLGSLNRNKEFKQMWHKCMNGVETKEEFETLWNEMMDTHVPPENSKWL